ncbi:MAG: YXWGXW repeat-containing protein, partial [Bacteroidota bacterium]|nr:YXWGXW repeat-containing protein [Bacteroidota bacterium]
MIITSANAQVNISIRIGPPALPVYEQPYCPYQGYLWMPGYWDYDDSGYYWVPGMWVSPPQTGFLWTPGYWGFAGGFYNWHGGYWGRNVGYYGGINYGYGYGGRGYYGGEWQGNTFRYNTAITRVNTTVIHNTYINKTVVNNNIIVNNNRTSFNGQGGVVAKPTTREQVASRQPHLNPTTEQVAHRDAAKADKTQYATANHGRPPRLAEQVNATNGEAKTQNKGVNKPAITKQDNLSKDRNSNDASKPVTTQTKSTMPALQKADQSVLKQQRVNRENTNKQTTTNQENAAVQSQ